MLKEQLRNIRSLPATPAILREGKREEERTSRTYYGGLRKKGPKYDVLCRGQQHGGIIKLALFLPQNIKKGIKTPKYEVYVNSKGKEWITRVLDTDGKETGWSTAMIYNLPGIWEWHLNIYLTQDTKETINRTFAKTTKGESLDHLSGLSKLFRWQKAIKEEKIEKKEQEETKPWDDDMKLVPKIPASFKEWIRKDVCGDVYIIYEYKKGGAKIGYCSRCRKMVPITKPHHNDETVCPHCKAKAILKSAGKVKCLCTGTWYGQLVQKINGGIIVRTFSMKESYAHGNSYKEPRLWLNEWQRDLIFESEDPKTYVYGMYKNKYTRWNLDEESRTSYAGYYWGTRMMLYKKNLKSIAKTSPIFRQSSFDCWPDGKLPTTLTRYLAVEKKHPVIEKLAKVGLLKLTKSLINESWFYSNSGLLKNDATELTKILQIDQSRLKRLKEMDGDICHLRWMQFEKLINKPWPNEMIKDLGDADVVASDFGFLNPPINYVRAYHYLLKQSKLMGEDIDQALTTWRDYHNMADQLKMNTRLEQIERPKDLKAAHEEAICLKEAHGIKKQATALRRKWPKVEKHLKQIQKFEYKSGRYQIIAPKKIDDIVKEGVILRHCVHTCDYYFSRIQTDESYLFFLRKVTSPDMPWYTLEVEPSGNIRQKRTTGDNQNKDFEEAIEFLKEWQKFFTKQLTKKEKELGEKSNELRVENYKQLRKNQNKVWHGKLAGQLLADVLEADFMAVAK